MPLTFQTIGLNESSGGGGGSRERSCLPVVNANSLRNLTGINTTAKQKFNPKVYIQGMSTATIDPLGYNDGGNLLPD